MACNLAYIAHKFLHKNFTKIRPGRLGSDLHLLNARYHLGTDNLDFPWPTSCPVPAGVAQKEIRPAWVESFRPAETSSAGRKTRIQCFYNRRSSDGLMVLPRSVRGTGKVDLIIGGRGVQVGSAAVFQEITDEV